MNHIYIALKITFMKKERKFIKQFYQSLGIRFKILKMFEKYIQRQKNKSNFVC